MRKRAWSCTLAPITSLALHLPLALPLVLPLLWASPARAQEAPPDEPMSAAAVRALLERSHLLNDTYFEVPTAILEQYLRDSRPANPFPVPFVYEESRYHLTLKENGEGVLSTALRVRVLDPQTAQIPVLSTQLAWQTLRLNGKPIAARPEKDWLMLVPPGAGVFELTAQGVLQPSLLDAHGLSLPTPLTSQTQVLFDAVQALTLEAGPTAQIFGKSGTSTHGSVQLPPSDRLSLAWHSPASALERPPRYEMRGVTAWNLDETTQQVTVELEVAIVDGQTEQLDFDLPQVAEKLEVTGPDVRETQFQGSHVTVYLKGKTAENTRMSLRWEAALPASGLKSFQAVQLRDGHWEAGTVVISNSSGNAEVLPEAISGLTQIALADVPEQARALLAGTPVLAYSVASRQFSAQVDVVRLGEFALRESIADLAHYELTWLEDGTLMGQVRYEIRNRNKQFLQVSLPPGARILAAKVNEKTMPLSASPAPGTGGAGTAVSELDSVHSSGGSGPGDVYRLPLVRSTSSIKGLVSFPVELVFLSRVSPQTVPAILRKGEVSLPLPRIDLPIAYAWCNAYVPDKMKVFDWRGPLKQVERFSSETATESLGYGLGMATEGYAAMQTPSRPSPAPASTPVSPPVLSGAPALGGSVSGRLGGQAGGAYGAAKAPATRTVVLQSAMPSESPLPAQAPPAIQTPPAEDPKPVVVVDEEVEAQPGIVDAPAPVVARTPVVHGAPATLASLDDVKKPAAVTSAVEKPAEEKPADTKPEGKKAQDEFLAQVPTGRMVTATVPMPAKTEPPAMVEPGSTNPKRVKVVPTKRVGVPTDRAQPVRRDARAVVEVSEESSVIDTDSTTTGIVWKSEEAEPRHFQDVDLGLSKASRKKQEARQKPKAVATRPSPEVPPEPEAEAEPEPPPPPPPSEQASLSLARNYWRAGKEAYERGDLTVAAKNLENAVALAQGSAEPEISNASRLLDNIQLAQGSLSLNSRAEKAAGAQVQRELNANNQALEQQQQQNLNRGLEAARAGRNDEAWVQLEAAEKLSEQLVAQGADKREQDARLRSSRETLNRIEATDRAKAEGLKREMEELKEEGRYEDALKSAQKLRKIASGKRRNGQAADPDEVDAEISALTVAVVKAKEAPATTSVEAQPDSGSDDQSAQAPVVTRSYDVGGLTDGDDDATRNLLDQLQSLTGEGESTGGESSLQLKDGRLIVQESAQAHAQIETVLSALEAARGPRVELGARIAQQQADGLVKLDEEMSQSARSGAVADLTRFRRFVLDNYDWQLSSGNEANDGTQASSLDGMAENLREKADLNLGQKVDVSSLNLSLNAAMAGSVGVRFSQGAGNTLYALVDDAQLRTLLEVFTTSGRAAGASRMQEALVGTEALLSDQQRLQVRFAGEKENRLEVNGQSITLPHDMTMLLIRPSLDPNRMTLVRAGAMQHWSRRPIPVTWITAPQAIELPRIGKRISFEKTLLEPGDAVALHATFSWKGGSP